MQSRLAPRLADLKLHSFEDYYSYLTASNDTAEFTRMVTAITINETYFFRSEQHFEHIQYSILPQLIKQKKQTSNPRIRLWSAACSAGDEPYTLAIILHHHFIQHNPDIRFEIIASDIDPEILSKAKRGRYNTYSIRNIPDPLLEKYFTRHGEEYQLKKTLADLVTFRRINLTDSFEMMSVTNIDLAICANVLIYFPKEIRQKVVTSIYNSLNAQSFFMVGFSETLFGIEHQFKQVREGKSITFQKGR